MGMIHVSSSNISKIGYEGTTLYVEFKNGTCYAFYNVSEAKYIALMASSSKGTYFAANIKDKHQSLRLS